MNRDDIIVRILRRCGQRQGDAVLTAQLETEIINVQSELEAGVKCGQQDQGVFYPWFLYKEAESTVDLTLVETIALPTDFISEYDEDHGSALRYTPVDSTTPSILRKDNLDIIRAQYTSGATFAYAIVGGSIYIRPLGAIGTLRLMYYGQNAQLAAGDDTNDWTKYAPRVLTAELGVVACQLIQTATMLQVFTAESKAARDQLYAAHVQREEAARQRQRGDD